MDKILNQFRRNFYDHGSKDMDFTEQEVKLKKAQERVIKATEELLRASGRLNKAALDAGVIITPLN